MERGGVVREIARWVALGALFLIPITPLIVANTYFFPFITGKGFYFRILVEIAVGAWAVLAFVDRAYRPRRSLIGIAVLAFIAWMFVADAFAVNAAKAFWSNFERMEGWVLLAHLLGFFAAAGAVLRVEKKWRAWFLTSLGVSVVVCGYALLQLGGSFAIHQGSTRVDATFGNSAYLAIYLLFNVCIALWLALTEKYAWLKWMLIVLSVIEAILIFYTETRGTVIALVVSLGLAAFLTALTAGKRARGWAAAGFLALAVVAGGFYLVRNSDFVQQNHVLQRIASISPSDGKVRFTLWSMAMQGVAERPIVGWGQEGFNYIFNKYYDPSLYQQEQWFDRAHNAFIDWLTAGGVPALLLYLTLFGTAFLLLWKSSELSRPERIALTAALVGYGVHTIFVFDNLYSYIYFFAILALIDSQVGRPIKVLEEAPEATADDALVYALPISAIAVSALMWWVNASGMNVATGLIHALSSSDKGIEYNIAQFKELAKDPSFAAQEIREQLISFASMVIQNSGATAEQKQQVFSLALDEINKQIAAYPLDAREHLELSYLYRAAGDRENALKALLAAVELSPKKESMWIEIGATQWDLGKMEDAKASFSKAYELGPQFPLLATYVAAVDIVTGDTKSAHALLLDTQGTTTVNSDVLLAAYYRVKDWKRVADILQIRIALPDATAQTWFSLAATYYAAGDAESAIATIHKAAELYPEAASSAEAAIRQIQGR